MAFTRKYEIKLDYPAATRSATIYLHGLLCLWFNGKTECTVGVNKRATTHAHKLEIWKKQGASCTQIDVSRLAGCQNIEISVNNPAEHEVYVYAPTSMPPPAIERYSYVDHCLDLEEIHDGFLDKVPEALSPRYHIKNGFFCGYRLTDSLFILRKGTEETPPKRIAAAVAADIFLNPKGYIEFNGGPGKSLKLDWDTGFEYEIAITNSCSPATRCTYDVRSSDPRQRNDFYLHYETTTVSNPANQFELINTTPDITTFPIKLGGCKEPEIGDYDFSDPAPCAPIGFGNTSDIS
jgi:hypothetical protein